MKLLYFLFLFASYLFAAGPELPVYDIKSVAQRFHLQGTPEAVRKLETGTKKEFDNFIAQSDSVILRTELALGTRAPQNLRIIFVSPGEMTGLTGLKSMIHLGWVPGGGAERPSVIYLSIESGLNTRTLHFLA